LRSDIGHEYELKHFNEFFKHDIIHETTPPYSPEFNDVAERKNRILKNMMNSMFISSGALLNRWGEVILSACHIQNRIPYKKTGITRMNFGKDMHQT